jgi:transcriptional regulator with XRE-family HTH domain
MSRSKIAVAESQIAALVSELKELRTALAQISPLQAALIALARSLPPGQDVPAVPPKKWPTYLREWRESRGKRLDDIGKAVGLSKGQLSRVERGHQPYSQPILEAYAEALGCRPGDLLTHPPYQPELALQSRSFGNCEQPVPVRTRLGEAQPVWCQPAERMGTMAADAGGKLQ